MSKMKLKWGILGYAGIAKNSVIPAIVGSDNSELHAVASRDQEKLKDCGERFGCKRLYGSYEELLNDPEIEAVYIPLPNSMHKEWTIKAARKGKHILCEKPVSMSSSECIEMIEECKKNGVKLMEAFMYRYTIRTGMVQELIKSNIIGQIKHIYSTFSFLLDRTIDVRWDPALGGGSLMDIGCYPINFVGMILGAEPVSMKADCIMKNGVDLRFSAVLKYENDVVVDISCGFDGYFNQMSQITGTKGTILIPDTFFDNSGRIIVRTSDGEREIKIESCDKYKLEIEGFADAIINGREPLVSMDETLRNMRIIEKLLEMTYRRQ